MGDRHWAEGGTLRSHAHLPQTLPEISAALSAPQAGGHKPEAEVEEFGLWRKESGGNSIGGSVLGAAVHPKGAHGVTLPAAPICGASPPPSRRAQRRIAAYLQHQLEAVASLHLRGQVAGNGEEREHPVVAPGGGIRQRLLRSPGAGEGSVHALLQPFGPHRLPEQPELEAVDAAAALHRFVPGVERHVVEFVSLEEVRGARPVAALQQPLWETGVKVWLYGVPRGPQGSQRDAKDSQGVLVGNDGGSQKI